MFRICLLLFSFVTFTCLSGQNPSVRKYSSDNGLLSNTVYNLFQTTDGYMYAGTDLGIVRFNGHQSMLFDAKNARSRAATGFVKAPDNTIYGINFAGELLRWDSLLTVIPTPNSSISQLACDSLGRIWIAGEQGLFVLYPGSNAVTEIKAIKDALSEDIGLATGTPWITQDSIVWFVGVSYVYSWDGKTIKKYSGDFARNLPGQAITYVLFEWQGNWYMLHKFSLQLLKLNGDYFEVATMPGLDLMPGDAKITNVVLLNEYWWICTYSGVVRLDPQSGNAVHWFKDKVITDVHFDHEGNYWFSTLYEGLLWCADPEIIHWRLNDDSYFTMSASNGASCLASKQNGDLYLFDSFGNSNRIERRENSDIQFIGWNTQHLHYEIASNGILYKVVGNETEPVHSLFSSLRYILYREDESIYCSRAGTFRMFSKQTKVHVDTLSEVPSRIAEYDEQMQTLAVATNAGLAFYKQSGNTYSLLRTCFPDSVIYTICRGYSKGEWLFSTASGIVYSVNTTEDPKVFYRPPAGLFPRQILNGGNRLWISTNDGLLLFESGSVLPFVMNRNDGLISNSIEHVQIRDSQVYISTPSGINRFPLSFRPDRKLPNVQLHSIIINGQQFRLPINGSIDLPYNGSLAVKGDIIGFCSEKGYEIGYRFSSSDGAWTYVTLTNGELNFSGFPSGEWTLQLVVRDASGKETPVYNVVAVNVIPPFWQRWWFYAGMIVVLIIVSTLVFIAYVSRLKKKQLREIRQMRLLNELNLSQQTALTAQMNPHFIFNVLNSIKGFIYQEDKKNATRYLNSFSDLVRRVLSMSNSRLIRLSEELEMIRLYTDLESSLLKPPFEFELIVDEEVEATSWKIPSLIIQPFVENAFKHGLRFKVGLKKLTINVSQKGAEQVLEITIEDNGIGRIAASQLHVEDLKRKSFAVGASMRRLSLLNSERKDLVGVEIIDLYDINGTAEGTRVILKIDIR